MPEDIRVKICGLKRPEDVAASVNACASYLGFNFFPKSPRYLEIPDAAALAVDVPEGVAKVALTVDADDALLDALTGQVPIDILQLHGSETPERVLAVKSRYGVPVMKVVGVATKDDLPLLDAHSRVADQLLVDAKPPPDADRPGGNAVAFDWNLIASRRWSVPWMLAGGLTSENVAEGIALTGAKQVDVASGVEKAPGIKDAKMIADFIAAARK
ncbi:phosphoribosylanthranilate isomerase [uncultured Roseovarius sp.]|uniref:phosphoribosylanthranilate isomerase n=1 Tax=uncultured Roseovarius sp. TaxID=293344 RepID=UPI002612AECB|nr:phosphoribosylanthranilate isomerase [uncultured Roseovarius sp.]